MKFNEQKAIEIVKKFNLSEKTIAVWRLRDAIPNKYDNADFKLRAKEKITGKVDKELQKRVVKVLLLPAVNADNVSNLAKLDKNLMRAVIAGTNDFTNKELTEIIVQFQRLKIEGKELLESLHSKITPSAFKKLIGFKQHPLIKFFPFLDRNKEVFRRIEWAIKSDNPNHISGDLDFIKKCLIVFLGSLQTK